MILNFRISAKEILDRTMVVPGKAVAEAVQLARQPALRSEENPKRSTTTSSRIIWRRADFERDLARRELPTIDPPAVARILDLLPSDRQPAPLEVNNRYSAREGLIKLCRGSMATPATLTS